MANRIIGLKDDISKPPSHVSETPRMAGGDLASSLLAATNFAAMKHKGQKRKDPEGTPYINHPIGVAHILAQVHLNVFFPNLFLFD